MKNKGQNVTEARPQRPNRRQKSPKLTPGKGEILAAYYCPLCPFVTWSSPAILSHHLRSHIGIQHCSVCGVSAPSTPALHQHIARRHMCTDKTSYHSEDYLTDAPDACLSGCEVCRLVQHYDRRVLSHCCFLCDYADPNPLVLYRHVTMGHAQVASTQEAQTHREMEAERSDTNKPDGIVDGVSERSTGTSRQGTERHCENGPTSSPPSPPGTMTDTRTSPPALSTVMPKRKDVDISVPFKKRRNVFHGSDNKADSYARVSTPSARTQARHEGFNEATRLSERPMNHQNGYVITSGMTYSVSFCSVWTPRPSSPPALEQEVPMDLSVRKAPSIDFSQTALPVISSVFSLKDYY